MVSLLKKQEILGRHMLGNTALYDAINAGEMTPPVKLHNRMCAWPAHESDAILRAKIAGRSKEEIRQLVRELVEQRKAAAERVAA